MHRLLVVTVLCVCAWRAGAATARPLQQEAAEGALIRGEVVTDDQVGTPLRRARVSVQTSGGVTDVAFTDDRGRFAARAGGAGDLTLVVSKPGYAPHRLRLARAAFGSGVVVRLARGAAINGTVVDTRGQPAAGAGVRVQRLDALPSEIADEYVTDTDDRGEFRVGSLGAGRYAVTIASSAAASRAESSLAAIRGTAPPAADNVIEVTAGREVSVTRVFDARTERPVVPDGPRGPAGSAVAATSATILGRIVDATGRAVAGATVRATHVAIGSERVGTTDAQGRYRIAGVPPGLVHVAFLRTAGTVGMEESRRLAQRIVVQARATQTVDFSVPPGAVIEGFVVDDDGEPLDGVSVHLWRTQTAALRTTVQRAGEVPARRTDDRGHFRLHGIPPGVYYVAAVEELPSAPGFGAATVVRRVFHPDPTADAPGAPLQVAAGQAPIAVQITIARSVAATRVHGRIADSGGAPFRGSLSLAVSARSGVPVVEERRQEVTDGTFAFVGVPRGEYVLKAVAAADPGFFLKEPGNDPRESATAFVRVTGADVETFLQTATGSTLSGRVVLEGDVTGRAVPDVTVLAVPADPDLAPLFARRTAAVGVDGSFEITNLSGPVRIQVTGLPQGWWLKSATVDGINAAEDPVSFGRPAQSRSGIDVVLSAAAAEVTGAVTGANGRSGAVVLLFPTESRRWYERSPFLRLSATDERGAFSLAGVPPEDYLAAAVDARDVDPLSDEWQHIDVLSAISVAAQPVTLREGAVAKIRLRAVRLPR